MQKISLSFRAFYWCALLLAILISPSCSSSYRNKKETKDAGMDIGLDTNIDKNSGKRSPQEASTPIYNGTQVPLDAVIPSEDATSMPLDGEQSSEQLEASVDASPSESTFPDFTPPPDAGDNWYPPDAWFTDVKAFTLTGGLEPGERAPALGEAPSNDYGGPVKIMGPPGSRASGRDFECPRHGIGRRGASHPPGTLPVSLQCVEYWVCVIPCTQDSECSDGDSGNASAECYGVGQLDPLGSSQPQCRLVCEEDTICPDGMVCISGRAPYPDDPDRGTCMWPVDTAIPGCPAWCELDPVPKGCPGWCAALGVGCDPDVEDYCCEGLVCNPKGWCVEEGI